MVIPEVVRPASFSQWVSAIRVGARLSEHFSGRSDSRGATGHQPTRAGATSPGEVSSERQMLLAGEEFATKHGVTSPLSNEDGKPRSASGFWSARLRQLTSFTLQELQVAFGRGK
jgi:hypothetical protein